jgi:hypothetical protein
VLALASGLIAASALAVVGYVSLPVSPQQITQENLAADISLWMADVTQVGLQPGRPTDALLREFSAGDLHRRSLDVIAWRHFQTPRGERGVVYDLAPRAGTPGRLFVIKSPHQYAVRTSPFTTLQEMTGGLIAGAWQRGDLLYVIVVGPGGRSIEEFVRPSKAA